MSRRDPAGRLLGGAVRLLPAQRREWGHAMRAELAGLDGSRSRWRFVLGCVRAVLTQRMTGIGYLLLAAATLGATVALTSAVEYPPLRAGLVALAVILLAVPWLGRRRGIFGPVAPGPVPRLVGAVGYLIVGAVGLGFLLGMLGPVPNPAEKLDAGLPILAAMLSGYFAGFGALTARRCVATAQVLLTGVVGGLAAAAAFVALVVALPPIPATITPALGLIAVAALVAWRGAGPLAALCAGTVAAPLIVVIVQLAAGHGPAVLIPDLAPPALSPVQRLAESRIEIHDPYVGLLFLGSLTAAALAVVSVATRRPATAE